MKTNKLLIIIDMQNDFITGSLGTSEAQAIFPKVIEKVKNWDGYVVATMDTHKENYLETSEGKKLPIKHCIVDTEGWYVPAALSSTIIEKMVYGQKTPFIQKNQFGTLAGMCSILGGDIIPDINSPKECDVAEIQLIGLCTDCCVISNAMMLKALASDIPIVVDASCCAGTTPEKHKEALSIMESCQIDVINKEE